MMFNKIKNGTEADFRLKGATFWIVRFVKWQAVVQDKLQSLYCTIALGTCRRQWQRPRPSCSQDPGAQNGHIDEKMGEKSTNNFFQIYIFERKALIFFKKIVQSLYSSFVNLTTELFLRYFAAAAELSITFILPSWTVDFVKPFRELLHNFPASVTCAKCPPLIGCHGPTNINLPQGASRIRLTESVLCLLAR